MPDLVVMQINGSTSLRIDYVGKSREQVVGRELHRFEISDAEAALGLERLTILYEGAFK